MIVKSADPDEYEFVYAIIEKAFKDSRLERFMVRVTSSQDPNFRKGDLRVVKIDEKIVSMLLLIRKSLRIGAAIVNGAIVGPVATLPEYQRRGYCSVLMKDAIEYMKTENIDISILWGHPWLYPKYGFSPAMMNAELAIKSTQSEMNNEAGYLFRPLEIADLEQITSIYHSNTSSRTGAELRSATMWEWQTQGSASIEVIIDKMDQVFGYLVLGTDWGRPCALEIGVLNTSACKAVYNRLIAEAKRRTQQEFLSIIHPDHPFAKFAFLLGGEYRIRNGGGAGMARVINLSSILTKMAGEFERRLRHSELYALECVLSVTSEEESTTIDINQSKVSTSTTRESDLAVNIPLACLNALITGYQSVEKLLENPCIQMSNSEQIPCLLKVLFPAGYPTGGFLPLVWD